jgi:hypothetical protein
VITKEVGKPHLSHLSRRHISDATFQVDTGRYRAHAHGLSITTPKATGTLKIINMNQSALGDTSDSAAPAQQSETPAVNFLCVVGNWLHTRSLSNEYFLDTEFRDKLLPGLDWGTVDPE